MAMLDGMYLTALSEQTPYELEATDNPVEEGIPLTDHTERKSMQMTLDCVVVSDDKMTGAEKIEKLKELQKTAKIVKFVGRNIFEGIVLKVDKTSTHEVANGFTASIVLKEIRIAKSPFDAEAMKKANAGLQQLANQNSKPVYHTVVKGDCLINIAKKYGTTLDFIIKHNKIPSGNPNLIYPGERYLVKNGTGEYEQGTVSQTLSWKSVAEVVGSNKKPGSSSTTHTSSSGREHGGAGKKFGSDSTTHTSSSGRTHGGAGRTFTTNTGKAVLPVQPLNTTPQSLINKYNNMS